MAVIIKPIVTEKQTALTDKFNKYGFIVDNAANKIEIKKAVEEMYNVTVEKVNTLVLPCKNKTRYTKGGVIKGSTSKFKKAIVSLKEGDKIDFYSNI